MRHSYKLRAVFTACLENGENIDNNFLTNKAFRFHTASYDEGVSTIDISNQGLLNLLKFVNACSMK